MGERHISVQLSYQLYNSINYNSFGKNFDKTITNPIKLTTKISSKSYIFPSQKAVYLLYLKAIHRMAQFYTQNYLISEP